MKVKKKKQRKIKNMYEKYKTFMIRDSFVTLFYMVNMQFILNL